MAAAEVLSPLLCLLAGSPLALLWTCVAVGAAVAGWAMERRRRASLLGLRQMPGPWTRGLPLIGNLLEVMRLDFHRLLLQWANTYGGVYRVRALWIDGVVVTDPKLLATICGRGPGAMDKASIMYSTINQMCSPAGHANLLTSLADPAWRAVRKAVAVAFSLQNIKKKYPVIRSCSERLIGQLAGLAQSSAAAGRPAIVVDVDQAALRVTLDVIGLAGFGHDYRSVYQGSDCTQPAPPTHLLRILPRCFTEAMNRLISPGRALCPPLFKYGPKGQEAFNSFQREMRVLLRNCLLRPKPPPRDDTSIGAQLWRAYHEQQPAPPPPAALKPDPAPGSEWELRAGGLLPPPASPFQLLCWRLAEQLRLMTSTPARTHAQAGVKAGGGGVLLTAERLLSEIGILFVEGFETTGHTISWTLLNIATVPGVQDRVAAELASLGLLATPASAALAAEGKRKAEAQPLADLSPSSDTTSPGSPWDAGDPATAAVEAAAAAAAAAAALHRLAAPAGDQAASQTAKSGKGGGAAAAAGVGVGGPSCWPLPRSVELDDLPRLKYLNACIKEAMRMLPVVSVMGRTSGDAPLQLGPYTLPPRTTVGIPLYAIQNADANWERAADFLPERWMKVPVEGYVVAHMPPLGPPGPRLDSHTGSVEGGEALTAAEARGALEGEEGAAGPGGGQRDEIRFMPFSEGPRNCVGQTLARIEVVAVLAGLLGAFRLELAPEMGGLEGVRERESTLLTLQVRGSQGLRMALTPRWLP